jgi:hypothetical protein
MRLFERQLLMTTTVITSCVLDQILHDHPEMDAGYYGTSSPSVKRSIITRCSRISRRRQHRGVLAHLVPKRALVPSCSSWESRSPPPGWHTFVRWTSQSEPLARKAHSQLWS